MFDLTKIEKQLLIRINEDISELLKVQAALSGMGEIVDWKEQDQYNQLVLQFITTMYHSKSINSMITTIKGNTLIFGKWTTFEYRDPIIDEF